MRGGGEGRRTWNGRREMGDGRGEERRGEERRGEERRGEERRGEERRGEERGEGRGGGIHTKTMERLCAAEKTVPDSGT